MDASDPAPVKGLRGQVMRDTYGKGTKSEREAVFLDTGRERYLLRRKSGPAFGDKQLDGYVGREVSCDGFLLGNALLADAIREVK